MHNNWYDSANIGHSQRASEYIDTIVGMRLDQPSYWDSWKLIGRL